jgi:ATP-dependent protease ClpP protease subunit
VISRIKEMGVPVHTVVVGSGMSMGLYVSQFGTVRAMDISAQLMLHDIHGASWGDSDERLRRESSYALMSQNFARVLASRNTAGHNDPRWWLDNYLQRDCYLDAERALELGLVDYIVGSYPTPRPAVSPVDPESPGPAA